MAIGTGRTGHRAGVDGLRGVGEHAPSTARCRSAQGCRSHHRTRHGNRQAARSRGRQATPEAIGEVVFSAEYFRWFAEEARRPSGSVHPPEAHGRRHVSVRRPAGVVASLTPWNFPCSIQARKLAPALAAGCTVVARVSEKAPLAVTQMIGCLVDAEIPPAQ